MRFSKYQALGNDYLVADPSDAGFFPSPATVRALCDRNRGAGADGLLDGPLGPARGADADGAFPLCIWNPDGTRAEKSGNGIRIFALYLHDRGYAPSGKGVIRTAGGDVSFELIDPASGNVRIDMGEPSFNARALAPSLRLDEALGVSRSFGGRPFSMSLVSMGNPHCILIGPRPEPELAHVIGPLVEVDPIFPNRANVQFLEVVGPEEVRIEIWERGAGYTLASGSSACAAAAAARRLGLVATDTLSVRMPGGSVRVALRGGRVFLEGVAERVYDAEPAPALAARLSGGYP